MKEAADKYSETLKSLIPVVQSVSWADECITRFIAGPSDMLCVAVFFD